jgi:hypothetical protein
MAASLFRNAFCRAELLVPWMNTTLVDFYLNWLALAAWVWLRERRTWIAVAWIAGLACLGSMSTWLYITWALMGLRAGDPVLWLLTGRPQR